MHQFMTRILSLMSAARTDDRGASMVEYGLLVAFIAIVALVGVTALGVELNTLFEGIDFEP